MNEKLFDVIKENWLTPISTIFMALLMAAVFVGLVSIIDGLEAVVMGPKKIAFLAGAFLLAWIAYLIACLFHSRLPKAKNGTLAVLFCIEAENKQLFDAACFKLVKNFDSLFTADDGTKFKAICLPRSKIDKYKFHDKTEALQLLEATNCVLLVYVRYTADDSENAENFELRIDYGIRHPSFNEAAQNVLSHDMATLQAPVGKQRFVKAETIDIFNFTSQTLVCVFQYLLGFVSLLAGDSRKAFNLLISARKSVGMQDNAASGMIDLQRLIDDRLFVTLQQMASESMQLFKNSKNEAHLRTMCTLLEEANKIRPDTYSYNMNMAYAYIILDKNVEAAKRCIAKCKQSQQDNVWTYSEAFISAYTGHAPGSVIAKYKKAFATPYKSLSEIVDYIEFVLDREETKFTLHLAAALVYEEMGDQKLMKHHLSIFMKNAKNLDNRTKKLIESKMDNQCLSDCGGDCSRCKELVTA